MQLEKRLVENEGNMDYGIIYQIKQYHSLTREQLAKLGIVDLSPDQKREIALYQGRVLQELLDRDLTDVFSEANTGELNSELLGASLLGDTIRSIFPDGVPIHPNEHQVAMLYGLGGVYLYSIFREGVTIHKTETPGLESRGSDEREADTVAALKTYFDRNPGSEVALVYGGRHDFKQYVNDSFNPRIESVEFPFNLQVFTHKMSRNHIRNLLAYAVSLLRKK